MEHPQTNDQDTIPTLVAALGISDDMTCDEPPTWVTQALTDEQRAIFARLVLHSSKQGLGTLDTLAVLLFKLALQPNLPPQAAGYLAFSGAEVYAGYALNRARSGLGAFDSASVTGLLRRTIQTLDASTAPEEEDVDQDAGHGVESAALNGAQR